MGIGIHHRKAGGNTIMARFYLWIWVKAHLFAVAIAVSVAV